MGRFMGCPKKRKLMYVDFIIVSHIKFNVILYPSALDGLDCFAIA